MDEIEIQEQFDEVDVADDQDWNLLESIMGRYKEILTDEIELKSQTSLVEQEQKQHNVEKERIIKQNDNKKAELMEYFGMDKFNELYSMCLYFR